MGAVHERRSTPRRRALRPLATFGPDHVKLEHIPRTLLYEAGTLVLLDQRRLPAERTEVRCATAADVADAIRDMAVRGAPAIGVAAAYGVVLDARAAAARAFASADDVVASAGVAGTVLGAARPT